MSPFQPGDRIVIDTDRHPASGQGYVVTSVQANTIATVQPMTEPLHHGFREGDTVQVNQPGHQYHGAVGTVVSASELSGYVYITNPELDIFNVGFAPEHLVKDAISRLGMLADPE